MMRSAGLRASRAAGSALVLVLWCVAVLSTIAYSVLYASRLELRLAKNYGDAHQAFYAALAGVETAKAFLYEESRQRAVAGSGFNSRARDNAVAFRDIAIGRGRFDVVRPAGGGHPSSIAFGIADEEAKLDLNTASAEELARLPSMSAALAAAILDWRDADSELTPEGAEGEYYAALRDPYRIHDAPFESLLELLSVRGVSAEMLLGEDANVNGLLDPEENDGDASHPSDNGDGLLQAGWSAWLTAHSGVPNENAEGKARIDISRASAGELALIDAVSEELAQAIAAYRERRRFESIGDLLEVRRLIQPGDPAPGTTAAQRPASGNQTDGGNAPADEVTEGEKLVTRELFQRFADDVTVSAETLLPGVVNANTAPAEVLACLTGMDEELARSVVAYRDLRGPFRTIGDLLEVPEMTDDAFRGVCSRLTVRPGTFRIVAVGRVPSTRARKRLEVVVRMGLLDFETLYYREDS